MRPACWAARPASTAKRMAFAIWTGFLAPAIPLFINTAVAPSSMAMAASLAVPTPRVDDHRHFHGFDDDAQVCGIADPQA